MTLARVFALQGALQRRFSFVLTGEAALLFRGLATWWNVPDITYRSPVSARRPFLLSEVQVGSVRVPEVKAVHLTGGAMVSASDGGTVAGVRIAPESVLLADLARTSHPLQTFIGGCSLLRSVTSFDIFAQDASRIVESIERRKLKDELSAAPRFPGKRLAKAVAVRADAGVQSPAEGALLWALHCLLSPARAGQLVTQFEVGAGGNRYFLDLSIPTEKKAIEPDGAGKFDDRGRLRSERANEFVRRQQNLLDAGWAVHHVPAADLFTPDLLQVASDIAARAGITRRGCSTEPRGPLWRPWTPELFSHDRRH